MLNHTPISTFKPPKNSFLRMWATKFSKILDFSQKLGVLTTKKHPFLKNQVQISKMGQIFGKNWGLPKLGPVVEKICHVDEKFSSKKFFIFVKKMSSKLAKIGVGKMSSFGPRTPRETRIFFNIFTKIQVEKPRKKPRNSRETRIFLQIWGPNFPQNCQKFPGDPEISSKIVKNGRK